MGQAKLRGSFEERKRQGEDRLEQERIKRLKEVQEYEASLSPEQKLKRAQARKTLNMITAMALVGSVQ